MSAIYIPGVELPTMEQAYQAFAVGYDGTVYEVRLWPGDPLDEVNTKAISVPDHGDLIDRRELLNNWEEPHPLDYNGIADRDRVVKAPAVIPAEPGFSKDNHRSEVDLKAYDQLIADLRNIRCGDGTTSHIDIRLEAADAIEFLCRLGRESTLKMEDGE